MTYQIVKIARGKREVIETGNLRKLNNRLKQLRSSTRGGIVGRHAHKYPVRYEIEEIKNSTEEE